MTDPTTETPTSPLFIALASVLAAIESGVIAEGEVGTTHITDGNEHTLNITIRKTVRPFIIEDR